MSNIKARPILFSGPMVRAILDGRKTQTRRIVPNLTHGHDAYDLFAHGDGFRWDLCDVPHATYTVGGELTCPYGQPGDLLWCRETWAAETSDAEEGFYRPDYRATANGQPTDGRWRPSIHMPRWASRLTLRITDVRVQRVQEISEEDAECEGVTIADAMVYADDGSADFILAFRDLWDCVNAKRVYGWEKNPWVWALTFEVLYGNVDAVLAAA